MRESVRLIWLFIFLLGVNISFSTTITDCLCANQTIVLPKIKLICDNNFAKENVDTRYYSCYREIFENDGKTRHETFLQTDGCQGSTLDTRIPNAFKDLNYYDISNHNLDSLTPDDLRFNRLKTLYAKHNKLTFIPAGLFIHAPRISDINLSFNNITALEAGAFSELSHLRWLTLDNNPIQYFDGKILLPLHFQIESVSIPWENIEVFDISNMNGAFDFHYASGRIFEGFAFGKKEEKSYYSHRTRHYEKDCFENLKVFNASSTPVVDVVDLFGVFGPLLEVLDVSSTHIGQLNGSALDRFSNLHHLKLSNTNLTSFDFEEIHNRAELKVLDISFNNLNKINYSSGAGSFKKLESLNLIGNKLTEINFVTPANFPKLTSLGISQNQFTCNYLEEFLRQWSDLQLFENDSSNQKHEHGIDCRDN